MTKEQATSKAKKLLKKVKGKNWNIQVWDNLGWHYCLQGNFICLHEDKDNTYHAMISDSINGGGGLAAWTGDYEQHKDPNKAINYALKNAEKRLKVLINAFTHAKDCVTI